MIQSSRLLPGIVHEITFRHLNAAIHLMDVAAADTYLFVGLKNLDGELTINDCIGGVWGAEERLVLPPQDNPRRLTAWFKFTGTQIEVWNDAAVHVFSRVDAARAGRIALSRLQGVDNPSRSLTFRVMTPDAMDAEISFQVLNRRLEQLEGRGLSPVDAAAPGKGQPT